MGVGGRGSSSREEMGTNMIFSLTEQKKKKPKLSEYLHQQILFRIETSCDVHIWSMSQQRNESEKILSSK